MIELVNAKKAEVLFQGWRETMIWSCLEGVMGKIVADREDEPRAAVALLADFCFLAGRPDETMLQYLEKELAERFVILVPQNEQWGELIEATYGEAARKITRYAIKKDGPAFDRKKLEKAAELLSGGFEIRMMDEKLYHMCRSAEWSRDLVSQFPDYSAYERQGLGTAVLKDGELVAGASSYTRYTGGIEIEIDTKVEYRRQGLAYACGARLILECLKRGSYPSWDAHNPGSVALAEKLGYEFDHEYTAYECIFQGK